MTTIDAMNFMKVVSLVLSFFSATLGVGGVVWIIYSEIKERKKMANEAKNKHELDPRTKLFVEFFHQQGVRFIDHDTGKEIWKEDENNEDET